MVTVSEWVQIISTSFLITSIAAAFYFSYKTLREIRNQLWISTFSDYTKRYSEIICQLPDAASDPKNSLLADISKIDKDKLMGLMRAYYDLCSEEYYLYTHGKLDSDTWALWEKGLVFTIRLPTFRDAWKTIKMEGYDEDFISYVKMKTANLDS